jgi:hypothetical protein
MDFFVKKRMRQPVRWTWADDRIRANPHAQANLTLPHLNLPKAVSLSDRNLLCAEGASRPHLLFRLGKTGGAGWE